MKGIKSFRVFHRVFFVLLLIGLPYISVGPSTPAFAQSAEPIKIGMLGNITGSLAAYGYSHQKVAKAAIAKINKEGGIAGRQVELYVEDDETKPSVGALKFRKLVETNGVSFVLNSNHSGVNIACAPIAKELKTLYFPCGSSAELSGKKGNRYVFHAVTNVRGNAKGATKWAATNLGKKWATIVVDYAWGQSNEEEFKRYIPEFGGVVLASIRVPLQTSNWLPYLKGKIPAEVEAVYFAAFGSDFLCFIRDLHSVRPDVKKLGAVYSFGGQDPRQLGPPGEGTYCLTPYPAPLGGLNTPHNKKYREIIGVDEEGRELGTGKEFVLGYNWAVWESIFALKVAIEKSGWKKRDDGPALIRALEGMNLKESLDFPQGDKYYRPEDHALVTGIYVEQIASQKIIVASKIPKEDTLYTPEVDRTKEPF